MIKSDRAKPEAFLLAAWSLLILAFTLLPLPAASDPGPPHLDKAVHAVLFGVFSGLLAFNLRRGNRPALALAALAGAVFALLIELVQHYLPYRSADYLDLAAGLAGIAVFLSLGHAYAKR